MKIESIIDQLKEYIYVGALVHVCEEEFEKENTHETVRMIDYFLDIVEEQLK